jgi:hypothetical protein
MQAAIEIQKGIKVLNPYPTESKYFSNSNIPYVDLAEAIAQIPTALRHVGLTVNVANVEYWWKFGTSDAELIAKSSGGTSSLILGDTSADAYRGDRGKTAYDHSQATHAPSNAVSLATVKSDTAIAGAISDKHTHSNKAVLDAIDTVAILEAGTVPLSQMSDMIFASSTHLNFLGFPETGSENVIYVAQGTIDIYPAGNYRWNGTVYYLEESSLLDKIVSLNGDIVDLQNGVGVFSDWSKAPTKPSYTPAEVGASPTTLSIFLQGNGTYFPQIFKWPATKTVSSVQLMSNCVELKVTIAGTQYTITPGNLIALNNVVLAANTQMTIDSIIPLTGNTAANALIIF